MSNFRRKEIPREMSNLIRKCMTDINTKSEVLDVADFVEYDVVWNFSMYK
jgi:hypothetical protein